MVRAISITHGKYIIRAMERPEGWEARAFLSGARQGSGTVAQAKGPGQNAVVEDVRRQLDEKDQAYRKIRRHDETMKFHVPSSEEYAAALSVTSFHKGQLAMLKAHAEAGESGMTAGELAKAGNYSDFSSANMHYGKAGRRLAESLRVEIPPSTHRQDLPTGVLAVWMETPGEESPGRWIMYPELVRAIKGLPL